MHISINYKKINKQTKEKHLTTEQENIKKGLKSKQNITFKSAKCTTKSFKRRKHET
jgi:hypothetical protein